MASKFDFKEQRENSAIKTEIVTQYFSVWSAIMLNAVKQDFKNKDKKIAYIDLFSGAGIYDDGTESTPIIILKKIIENKELSSRVVTLFNEKNRIYYENLCNTISSIKGIEALKYTPKITNKEINQDTYKSFMSSLIPCFSFIDPAGYSGLTINLISSLGKDFGSDIILFFNYNDINRAINNVTVREKMEQLFGQKRFNKLQDKIQNENSLDRETIIINEMAEAIRDVGMPYIIPFRFEFADSSRTSHYIIFASKHKLGFIKMKEVMYKIGDKDFEGIGKFGYIPSNRKIEQLSLITLFNPTSSQFKERLCKDYKKTSLTVKELIESDITKSPFITKQYKEFFLEMEKEGLITCIRRPKMRMGDDVIIKFP